MTSQAAPDATPVGGTSAAAVMKLLQDQLTEERSTKSSLEARAVGVITSAGALVTLIFALAALVTKSATYELPDSARMVLGATLLVFVAAAVVAIIAARPGSYQEVSNSSLQAIATQEAMSAPALQGEAEIANILARIIERARQKNGVKARFLRVAVALEAVAALLLAVAVSMVLLEG